MSGAELVTTRPTRPSRPAGDRQLPVGARLRTWLLQAVRDLAYAAAFFAWSIVGFCILVTGLSVMAPLLVLVFGVLVWFAFVYVARWTTAVDRALVGWQRRQTVRAQYRRPRSCGWSDRLRTVSSDPQTWRDLGWLALNSVIGFAFGLLVLTMAAVVVGWIAMPLWFWAVDHPQAQYGVTDLGLLTVDTLGEAALVSVAGLALAPVVLVVTRGCARAHSGLAALLLGPTHNAHLTEGTPHA
jgi:hypothetical protein